MRDLFFRRENPRLDRTLQRSRLATIMRFYLGRASRYGLLSSRQVADDLAESIDRLEAGIPEMRSERLGFVVNLQGSPQPPVRVRDTIIAFLSAADLASAGSLSTVPPPSPSTRGDIQQGAVARWTPRRWASFRPARPSARRRRATRVPPGPGATSRSGHRPEVRQASTTRSISGFGVRKGDVPPDDTESGAADAIPFEAGAAEEARAVTAPRMHQAPSIEVGLGERVGDGDVITWKPSVRGSPHLFVLGIPGQGKSWTVARILRALNAEGLPALVFDFHGQFSRTGLVDRAPSDQVVDAASGLPFSPFETEIHGQPSTWRTGAFAIAEYLPIRV